jgi:hypothetical protein
MLHDLGTLGQCLVARLFSRDPQDILRCHPNCTPLQNFASSAVSFDSLSKDGQ